MQDHPIPMLESGLRNWDRDSWKTFPVAQMPAYNSANLNLVESHLKQVPPIVDVREIHHLKEKLKFVCNGDVMLFQAGDCAETFANCNSNYISKQIQTLKKASQFLGNIFHKKTVTIGRIAGQFAKPRSTDFETIEGVDIPIYRGDIINGFTPNKKFRDADPDRMVAAYRYAHATYHLVQNIVSEVPSQFDDFFPEVSAAEKPIEQLYTSHEALLLPYESALTRNVDGKYYNLSAHFLWLGNRTRRLNSAHVEYLRGVENPIGIKIDSDIDISELIALLHTLNPKKEIGKITLVVRMGVEKVDQLQTIITGIQKTNHPVIWMCDPMHGNTKKLDSGVKVRFVGDIKHELKQFIQACNHANENFGGVHFELSGDDIHECLDSHADCVDLSKYKTQCDPRLNAAQIHDVLEDLQTNLQS